MNSDIRSEFEQGSDVSAMNNAFTIAAARIEKSFNDLMQQTLATHLERLDRMDRELAELKADAKAHAQLWQNDATGVSRG